jgi:hypothetical protein
MATENETILPGPGGRSAVTAARDAVERQVQAGSLMFLAEIVRRGGIAYAAALAEPLPGPERTELALAWLRDAEEPESTVDDDERVARWLEAVGVLVDAMTSQP